MNIATIRPEINDWVTNQLTGTVVGHISAATHLDNLDTMFAQFSRRRQNVIGSTPTTHTYRNYRLML
tara:strand:+ start:1917 stop:2117 length:201 start_codon:yes stop_codon:yes gene_type:complete